MITYEEAYKTMMESVFHTGKEQVPFSEASGRVLAAPVRSDMDMPPWDKSAVDGFACQRDDLGRELNVIETIPAHSFIGRRSFREPSSYGYFTCS